MTIGNERHRNLAAWRIVSSWWVAAHLSSLICYRPLEIFFRRKKFRPSDNPLSPPSRGQFHFKKRNLFDSRPAIDTILLLVGPRPNFSGKENELDLTVLKKFDIKVDQSPCVTLCLKNIDSFGKWGRDKNWRTRVVVSSIDRCHGHPLVLCDLVFPILRSIDEPGVSIYFPPLSLCVSLFLCVRVQLQLPVVFQWPLSIMSMWQRCPKPNTRRLLLGPENLSKYQPWRSENSKIFPASKLEFD